MPRTNSSPRYFRETFQGEHGAEGTDGALAGAMAVGKGGRTCVDLSPDAFRRQHGRCGITSAPSPRQPRRPYLSLLCPLSQGLLA